MLGKGVKCLQPPKEEHFWRLAIYAYPDGLHSRSHRSSVVPATLAITQQQLIAEFINLVWINKDNNTIV